MKIILILLLLCSCESPKYSPGDCIQWERSTYDYTGYSKVLSVQDSSYFIESCMILRNYNYPQPCWKDPYLRYHTEFKIFEENKDGYGRSHPGFKINCEDVK